MSISQSREALKKLKEYKKKAEIELHLLFAQELVASKEIDTTAHEVVRALEEYTLRGGKRIRAALTFYGFQCFSNEKIPNGLVRASVAMELLQSFLLIHDDIIDRDDLRRGGDTMHKIFEKRGAHDFSFHIGDGEREHFGNALAILAGDICFSLANIALARADVSHKVEAMCVLNMVARDTTFGQVLDVRSGYSDIIPQKTIATTLKIYTLKTAAYSIEVPLKLGAILAGARDTEVEAIKEYAEPLGVAYNIQDDLLGMFGEREKFGKPIGSDVREGKKTLLLLKTLEYATKKDRVFIQNNVGDKNISDDVIEEIKKIMLTTGAVDYCTKYARSLIVKSKKIMNEKKYHEEGKSFLLGIGDYLLEREC